MAAYEVHYQFQILDANGDTAIMTVPSGNDADTLTIAQLATRSAAFVTALGAPGVVTNGKVVRTGVSILLTSPDPRAAPLPIDAEFPSVADKALLAWGTTQGGKAQLGIPAPVEVIFHAPPADDTVDPSNAAMATLIAGYIALGADVGGNVFSYRSGVRRKSRARRRRTHRS
jgi:hypothetical protein